MKLRTLYHGFLKIDALRKKKIKSFCRLDFQTAKFSLEEGAKAKWETMIRG